MRVMAQFKVGDVVQLKSGGPGMTVSDIEADGVRCVWFAGNENKIGHFPSSILKLYEADSTESRSQPIRTGQWS